MKKIGLIGLFAAGAALFIAAHKNPTSKNLEIKNPDIKRDILLRALAQGLSDENFAGMQGAMLVLARDFGHQIPVQDCLITAIEDAGFVFGHARAVPLFDQIRQQTRSLELGFLVEAAQETLTDRSHEQAKARDQAVKSLSAFLRKSGFSQIDFDEGPTDIKHQRVHGGGKMMSPAEFLQRHDVNTGPSPQPLLRLS